MQIKVIQLIQIFHNIIILEFYLWKLLSKEKNLNVKVVPYFDIKLISTFHNH